MDSTLCGACGADGRGCTYDPHENCGFVNVLQPEIERLRGVLQKALTLRDEFWEDEARSLLSPTVDEKGTE